MRHSCMAVILTWLSVNIANAYVDPQETEWTRKSDGNDVEGSNTYWNQQCYAARIVCKKGFVQLGSNCLHFSTKTATWQNALKSCQGMGTTLAYPVNPHENTLLVNYLKINFGGVDYWWLGASDHVNEGQWVWAHSQCPIAYADWAGAQPDNNDNAEDCLHMNKPADWKWNDVPCSEKYRYICQQ